MLTSKARPGNQLEELTLGAVKGEAAESVWVIAAPRAARSNTRSAPTGSSALDAASIGSSVEATLTPPRLSSVTPRMVLDEPVTTRSPAPPPARFVATRPAS